MERKKSVNIVLVLLFLGLLSVPFGIKMIGEWRSANDEAGRDSALDRYGFYLEEVSATAGVDFVHQRPDLDPQLAHIMPQIASMGASVSISDFNNDGLQDFYLTNSKFGSDNALYMNLGDGSFSDIATEANVTGINSEGTGVSMGAVWGDYDNNGYEDLFLYKWGRPELYRNDGNNGFTRVTDMAGLPDWVNSNTAVWFDYDRDGYLDLFIGGYYQETIDLWNLTTTRIMPDSYEYATNGGRNWLFRNQGDGTFIDVTDETGLLETHRWTLAAGAADLNGSGYPDLVIANDYGVDEIFINQNGDYFTSAGQSSGMGFVPKSGMSVAFGDVMNQGQQAIYITNISEPGVLMQGNNLWVPGEATDGDTPTFRNLAGNMGIELGDWGYSGQFMDLNRDGNLDLYVANGYVSAEEGTDYWYDYAKVVGGQRNVIIDAKNWPSMNNRTFSGYQQNKIWLNDGAGRFREVSTAVGGNLTLDSRAVAHVDLWNRGVNDIIVANQNGPVRIYRNNVDASRQWIGFSLKGIQSNTSAIGAQVKLFWDGKEQLQTVSGGSGFSSQNSRNLHFGLGENPAVEKAEIHWPSGRRQIIREPEINRLHQISEPD